MLRDTEVQGQRSGVNSALSVEVAALPPTQENTFRRGAGHRARGDMCMGVAWRSPRPTKRGASAEVDTGPEWSLCIGCPHIGPGVGSRRRRLMKWWPWRGRCRGRLPLRGGWSVAFVRLLRRAEVGEPRLGIGGSEQQGVVAGQSATQTRTPPRGKERWRERSGGVSD